MVETRIISQYISPEVARGAEVRVHEGAVGHVSAAETRGSGHVAAGGHVEAVHLLVLGGGGGPAQEEAATGTLHEEMRTIVRPGALTSGQN